MISQLKENRERKGIDDVIKLDMTYPSTIDYGSKEKNKGVNPAVFRESPMFSIHEYRMSRLSSFAILGIDVKITPDGQVKVIEVNGINSGMKGFADAKVEYDSQHNPSVDELRTMFPFDLDNSELWSYIKAEVDKRNPCEDALRKHLRGLGDAPVAYIAARMQTAGKSDHRLEGAESVFGDQPEDDIYSLIVSLKRDRTLYHVHPGWEMEFGEIAETLGGIEKILEDKRRTDRLFKGLRELKPESYEYTEECYQRLLAEHNPRYVVVKPHDGARGEFLEIFDASASPKERPQHSSFMVAEPFIESKPILSSQDGQYHDGCMRYVVVVEETKQGEINIYHFGGYWRLCQRPITDSLDIDAMRANLSQGALAEGVSNEDLTLVRETVNRHIPTFYRNLVDEANPRKSLDRLMQEYQKLEKTG